MGPRSLRPCNRDACSNDHKRGALFFSGKSSAQFDPGFNRLFQLAATRSADSAFIATDWGSATQIYCGTNGNDGSVYELYENKNPDQAVIDIAAKTKKQFLYSVTTVYGKIRRIFGHPDCDGECTRLEQRYC